MQVIINNKIKFLKSLLLRCHYFCSQNHFNGSKIFPSLLQSFSFLAHFFFYKGEGCTLKCSHSHPINSQASFDMTEQTLFVCSKSVMYLLIIWLATEMFSSYAYFIICILSYKYLHSIQLSSLYNQLQLDHKAEAGFLFQFFVPP